MVFYWKLWETWAKNNKKLSVEHGCIDLPTLLPVLDFSSNFYGLDLRLKDLFSKKMPSLMKRQSTIVLETPYDDKSTSPEFELLEDVFFDAEFETQNKIDPRIRTRSQRRSTDLLKEALTNSRMKRGGVNLPLWKPRQHFAGNISDPV